MINLKYLEMEDAVNVVSDFENSVVKETVRAETDGVICGHIHRAAVCEMNGFLYTNAGDWVESCTALVENSAGQLGLVEWPDRSPLSAPASAAVTVPAHADLPRDRCLVTPN